MSLSKPDTIEEDAAIARDDFVIAVWNGTLPQAVEQDMRSTPTTNGGNFYVDLLSLHNQYCTALSVLASAGYSRPSAPNIDDNGKRTTPAQELEAVYPFHPLPPAPNLNRVVTAHRLQV